MKRIKAHENHLLLKCLRNEANPEEQEAGWEWIHTGESTLSYYETLKEAWIANAVNQTVDQRQFEKSWHRIEQRIGKSENPSAKKIRRSNREAFNISLPWSRLVAAVLFAFLLGGSATIMIYSLQKSINYIDDYYTIEAPRGAKSMVTLTDGSKVWLNAGSQIRFPKTFNRHNRDVYLVGEGYFSVARNEKLSFRVHTSGMIVKALGTEFNVKAYPGEGRVETTLVKGSVSISRNGEQEDLQSIILKPNQKASFIISPQQEEIQKDDVADHSLILPQPIAKPSRVRIENNINPEISVSWKDKRWVFERENLQSLVSKLERNYDVDIQFRDEELKEFNVSGTLEEESIEQVLVALQLTLPINFEIKHKNVYLSLNKEKADNYKQLLKLK